MPQDSDGNTPLISCAFNDGGRIETPSEIAQIQLDGGASLDIVGPNGCTALLAGAVIGNHGVVQVLLDARATVSDRALGDWTALMLAADEGHLEMMRLLCDAGADPASTTTDGRTCLIFAARHGYVEVMRELVRAGADVKQGPQDLKPLMVASSTGHAESVRQLLETGADPSIADAVGLTVLMRSVLSMSDEVARYLVRAGANMETTMDTGGTPLVFTAHCGNVNMVRYLIGA